VSWSTHRKVLLASCGISLAAGVLVWKSWIAPRRSAQLEFFASVLDPAAPAPGSRSSLHKPLAPEQPEDWCYYLAPETARQIFPIPASIQEYDPWTYFRQLPNLRTEQEWREHPEGAWTMRTNARGLREDAELGTPAADLRVLVAGDSHTFGVCNNAESFPNLLEAALRDRLDGRSVEVLNAGLGGFTLFHYFGTLLRERSFEPQQFVVAVYGGNDFAELLALEHRFQASSFESWPQVELMRRNKALKAAPYAMGQCFNQVQTFVSMPTEKDVAIDCALRLCAQMQEVCGQRGTEMIVVFIPAACSCSFAQPHPDVERGRAALGLDARESELNAELAERFTQGVRELRIPLLDLRERFARLDPPPFWRLDLHMNLEAQRMIAEELEPLVLRALESPAGARPR